MRWSKPMQRGARRHAELAAAAPKLRQTELAELAAAALVETNAERCQLELAAAALAELAAVRKERRRKESPFKTQQLGRKTQYNIILTTRSSSHFAYNKKQLIFTPQKLIPFTPSNNFTEKFTTLPKVLYDTFHTRRNLHHL